VQVRKRFIEEEGPCVAHDGPAHRDALALPAGEVAGFAVEVLIEFQQGGGVVNPLLDVLLIVLPLVQPKWEGDVLEHGQVGVQGVVLEHHGEVAIAWGEVVDGVPVDLQRAVADVLQADDHPQDRGLPAAGGAHEDDELAIVDLQIDSLTAVYPSGYVLTMPWRLIEDTSYSLALDCALGEPRDDAALEDEDDDDDRNGDDDRGSGDRPRGFLELGGSGEE